MVTTYSTQQRKFTSTLASAIITAALFSGCQSTRTASGSHPLSRLFDGYDYAAASEPGTDAGQAQPSDMRVATVSESAAASVFRAVSNRITRDPLPAGLTNQELVSLAQSGADTAAIVEQIQRQGGRFEVRDDDVRELEESGVSGDVVAAVKRIAAYSPDQAVIEQDDDGTVQVISIMPRTETRARK